MFSSSLCFGFSNITQITWEITVSLVDKYERRTTRTASTFVLDYPYGLPRRLFPTPILCYDKGCKVWPVFKLTGRTVEVGVNSPAMRSANSLTA